MINAPDVSGYLQTREVTLTCELHGYQSSPSPPVWFDSGGSEINTTTKYTITSGDGENIIVLENGTAIPSVIVSLTIHCLSSADEGTYTCRGVRGESITQLVIINGTAPSTTPPPTTINGGKFSNSYTIILFPSHYPPSQVTVIIFTDDEQPTSTTDIVLLPAGTVYALVAVIIVLLIALVAFIILILYLLWKIKILSARLSAPIQTDIPLSAPMQDREHTSPSGNVTYEEIAERTEMKLKTNESYVVM